MSLQFEWSIHLILVSSSPNKFLIFWGVRKSTPKRISWFFRGSVDGEEYIDYFLGEKWSVLISKLEPPKSKKLVMRLLSCFIFWSSVPFISSLTKVRSRSNLLVIAFDNSSWWLSSSSNFLMSFCLIDFLLILYWL